jgi:hypothetical protein
VHMPGNIELQRKRRKFYDCFLIQQYPCKEALDRQARTTHTCDGRCGMHGHVANEDRTQYRLLEYIKICHGGESLSYRHHDMIVSSSAMGSLADDGRRCLPKCDFSRSRASA